MRDIVYNGNLIATVGSSREGSFWSLHPDQPLQWGFYQVESPKDFRPHTHKLRKRVPIHSTKEFFYVIGGLLRGTLYSEEGKRIEDIVLNTGDFICTYSGGHSFEVGETPTRFLEVKSGPFTTVVEDKDYIQ